MTVKEILNNIYGTEESEELSDDDIKFAENRKIRFKREYGVEQGQAVSEENMRELENCFGKIPDALKKFYFLCGNNPNVVVGYQDQWFLPESYKKWDLLKYEKGLMIANENQGVCQALIRECDLGKENPPVYVVAAFDEGKKIYKPCAASVDEFIKAFLMYQGSLCMPYWNENFYFINENEFHLIVNNFSEYDFKFENWIVDGVVRFFYDTPDSVICVMGDDLQLHYGARSKESFEQLDELLGDLGEIG